MTNIKFDKPMRDRLRRAYDAAVEAKADTFVFEGNVYVTGYAKYLLEYLDGRLK